MRPSSLKECDGFDEIVGTHRHSEPPFVTHHLFRCGLSSILALRICWVVGPDYPTVLLVCHCYIVWDDRAIDEKLLARETD